MKSQPTFNFFALFVTTLLAGITPAFAQQYKLRQTTTVSGMKSESTIYVKGMRKRTEGAGIMGMGANLVTIEQCDLQRTIRINDKKKLYFIEPFVNIEEENGNEAAKPVAKTKAVPAANKVNEQKGGVVYMYYSITDTGERKKMYGFNARHVWSTQKIKPSADACMMKDSMQIKTDGWYIDLPQFNCPVNRSGRSSAYSQSVQPQCQDRFVSKRSGKGRLGFPLIETRIMIMGNGMGQTSEFMTQLETLEFSTVKLDSLLFEIPTGYSETTKEEDLQEKFDAAAYMSKPNQDSRDKAGAMVNPTDPQKPGLIRIGIYPPGGEGDLQAELLQKQLVAIFNDGRVEAIAVSSEEEARKYHCDEVLETKFAKLKQASKVGSLLKAIKNTDPAAATAYSIEASLNLVKLADGSTHARKEVNGKFDGKADEAAMKALEKAGTQLLNEIR